MAFGLAWILVAAGGCGAVRNLEQWKCDRWGMCHFGIQPSLQPAMAAAPCNNPSQPMVPYGVRPPGM
jgi:hypothetical protein